MVEVKQGRPGDGIVAAVERVGTVLAEHFPRSEADIERDSGQADRAMNLDDLPPPEVMWEGKFVRALRRGKWEYASRTSDIRAVVILAEHEGKVILVDQPRVPLGCRCIELPAGLVGDEDPGATPETTAIKELEEETGFTAESVERLGEFYASPGMLSESFTLVRAHGVRKIGDGGGTTARTSPSTWCPAPTSRISSNKSAPKAWGSTSSCSFLNLLNGTLRTDAKQVRCGVDGHDSHRPSFRPALRCA